MQIQDCHCRTLTDITDANPNNSSIPKTILMDVVVPHGILGMYNKSHYCSLCPETSLSCQLPLIDLTYM